MLNALRDNPLRAPNWRWLRAVQIDSGGPRASRAVDGPEGFTWIRRASRLKRRYEQAGNRPDQMYRLVQYDRDMFWAHSIWLDERAPTRWVIEARILAGETNEEIAKKLGTSAAVIEAYEAVFFDVRSMLENRDYIVAVVMSDSITRGLSERQYDLLWKLFGYQGGAHVLDAVISKVTPMAKPAATKDVGQFFQEFAVNAVKHRAAVATITMPLNSHTQLALIDSFVKYVEIEKTSETAEKAHGTIIDNIGAMMSSLPFRIGTKLDSVDVKMLPFDDGAAELNSAELMAVATGGKLEDQQAIQDLKFPGDQ